MDEHNLADVAPQRHFSEGLLDPSHRYDLDRQWLELAVVDGLDDLGQHFGYEIRSVVHHPVEIKGGEGQATPEIAQWQRAICIDVRLAYFYEAPVGGKRGHATLDRLTDQRIDDDIDARAIRRLPDFVGEIE